MLPVIALAVFSPTRVYERFIFPLGIWGLAIFWIIQNESKVYLGNPGWIKALPGLFFLTIPKHCSPDCVRGHQAKAGQGRAQAEQGTSQLCSMGNVPLLSSTAPWGMHVQFLFFTEHWLHQAPRVYRHITIRINYSTVHMLFCALAFKSLSEMKEDFWEYSSLSRQTESSISIQNHRREEVHPAGCRKQFQLESDLESDVESDGQISACVNICR